ncbi:hypothetical protein F5Y16DRAFT_220088 [Xylariaceae sp. FL0255]|nr:hypothetical protein F5Y16DRAFT_220088 [Xylariaceae sp. FL0255]
MKASTVLATLMGACGVLAAPTWPEVNRFSGFDSNDAISEYFNALAEQVSKGKQLDTGCDLSKAQMPTITGLGAVDSGLVLKHVAIGRGTQNYTCDLSNATAAPAQVGALATLFNASCVAASYPSVMQQLPRLALAYNVTTADDGAPATTQDSLGPTNMYVSGKHLFLNTTTPFFNLDTTNGEYGQAAAHKTSSVTAPTDAPTGQQGEAAVTWLKLEANPGQATGGLANVFRVNTAGGSPPASCSGMPATFQVQYAAEYWFWETSS